MPDNEFVNGLRLETKEGKYGEYIKGSINIETILYNPLNNSKYVNFMIFKSKAGKWYAVINKPQNQQENIISFNNIDDEEELPF